MPPVRIAGVVAGLFLSAASVALAVETPPKPAETGLVAHEWGTFTALQDDDGTALGAINSDDEPVPSFVCRAGGLPTLSSRSPVARSIVRSKGITVCHPGVTMRLETPVIYFYPPADRDPDAPVNVHVTFRGGWLTEYYPAAVIDAPDLVGETAKYPLVLTGTTHGSLAWDHVTLGAKGELTPTDDPVWTTPREVPAAAVVSVPTPKALAENSPNRPEKFLFYRGVGHLNSPLRVVHDRGTGLLSLYADPGAMGAAAALQAAIPADAAGLRVPAAWLIEIRPGDGWCAFRPVAEPLDLRAGPNRPLATLPAAFAESAFAPGHLQELRAAMQRELVADSLFPDEAAAMLKTWELSYFQSPGQRLFFVTPHAWTEAVLPLTIDGAKISRVMVGRIELVTPAQRDALARIAAGPSPDMGQIGRAYFAAGGGIASRESSLAKPKMQLPPVYQAFVDLGRFRDALVLAEQKQRPTAELAAFIRANELANP